MSYRHTLEATVENLHEIEDIIRRFPDEGVIPSIEIDLVLQKLRNIYELMLIMQSRPVASPDNNEPAGKQVVETVKETTVTVSVEKAPENNVVSSTVTQVEEKSTAISAESGKVESIKTKKTKSEKAVQTLADQFTGRPTLLESLHETYNKESRTLTHNKPVNDLMSAIGINDRFTFIRELFNNDNKAFESAIVKLNSAPDYKNAYAYMENNYEWDMDSEPVLLLLDIVKRKYL